MLNLWAGGAAGTERGQGIHSDQLTYHFAATHTAAPAQQTHKPASLIARPAGGYLHALQQAVCVWQLLPPPSRVGTQ